MLISMIGKSQKVDSIRVIMLVCDTAKIDKEYFGQWYHPLVWWQFGYEVWENVFVEAGQRSDGGSILIWDDHFDKIFRGRLDQNKKPLPKSIVVWMTKEIK